MDAGLLDTGFPEQVAFEDVAVDLTREEWGQLTPAQRTLHCEVMPETWGLLVSVDLETKLKTELSAAKQDASEKPSSPVLVEGFRWDDGLGSAESDAAVGHREQSCESPDGRGGPAACEDLCSAAAAWEWAWGKLTSEP
ncbi:PREDICTED: zinc finger protein 135 [Myotis davidii]|uniref:zinc finger protein 135 n=1 Tax=Myotis davidii TaxID=225400 RepID=UPI0007679ADA|nr:PREDICTED: zinc finger protein 135 [Myotis davidii]XP_015416294.1 PREDICTED: zinc finger protein 135 [Myotis davidii]